MRNGGQSYTVDLATMQVTSKHDYENFAAGYEQGYADGTLNGHQQAERELEAAWKPMQQWQARQANKPSFADLCESRGEPARAAKQRQALKERGLE